jgi:hypothetical protein
MMNNMLPGFSSFIHDIFKSAALSSIYERGDC